jgi:hypothetical protein
MTAKYVEAHYQIECNGCGLIKLIPTGSDAGTIPLDWMRLKGIERFNKLRFEKDFCEACAGRINLAISDAISELGRK